MKTKNWTERPARRLGRWGLMMALALTGCNESPRKTPDPVVPAVAVKMTLPRRGEITRTVTLPANVAANQQVALYSKVGGYLKSIHVDKGDRVKAGDLLAEIEVPELIADEARYRAEFELAKLEFRRAEDGQKQAPDLVMAQTLDSARAKLAVAQANLDRANTWWQFCRITAPFAGTIARRSVDPGAFIPAATSGSAAATPALMSLVDFAVVRVQVAVPEAEAPFIRPGLTARITVDELPGAVFPATVSRFSPALDEPTKTLAAELDLTNSAGQLLPGMYAMVKLGVETRTNSILVPVEALMVEKGGSSVFTVRANQAVKLPVKTGFNDGVSAEILEGLPPETPVILIGKLTLTPGQAVLVGEGKP